ncbi:hypothetical protein DPMN_174907 [Dreissena polymorpha]|uniref:Uncharacterized protein n=1 Tax=Dreissena polymorpha TaxID=45954 RepID=A0A9D4E6V4_DREPO|nr:hypothetical protein DPMN_174907 [Dreissena polymorpha]
MSRECRHTTFSRHSSDILSTLNTTRDRSVDIQDFLRIFEHDKDIIGTTFLIKFHDNQAINVAFRVLTRKTVDDALRTNGTTIQKSSSSQSNSSMERDVHSYIIQPAFLLTASASTSL